MTRGKFITYGLFSYLVFMCYVLVAGENGIFDYRNLQFDIANAEARNQRLSQRNQRLLKDVVDLKSRVEAVEELARNKLGMIKKGEIFYHIID